MEKLGKLIACDRCGAEAFLARTGEVEQDGGFTRYDTFENAKGWRFVSDVKTARLCPACASAYVNLIQDFFYASEQEGGDEKNI